MDLLLTLVICFTQFVLSLMGVYVALKPPSSETHGRWIAAFVIFGLAGIAATGWLAKRAGDSQDVNTARLVAATKAATDANISATNANNAATAAQNAASAAQNETSKAHADATKASNELQRLVNKRSKETAAAILNLGTETQLSLKSIASAPPPRRIPKENREALIKFFSQMPSTVKMSAIANDIEAYRFAQDWFDIFKASGWTIEGNRIESFIISGPPQVGIVIKFHGDLSAEGQLIQVPNASAAGFVVRAATALKVTISGQRLPDIKEGSVFMDFYARPPAN